MEKLKVRIKPVAWSNNTDGSVHHMALRVTPKEYASTTNYSKLAMSLLGQSAE
jgi:hypothetical protein